MNEELLGFDIRLTYEDYVDVRWNEEMRVTHLLNPQVKWPLSVDQMVWPSFFVYPERRYSLGYYHSNATIEAVPKGIKHEALELWQNRDKMRACFLKKINNKEKQGIHIAVSLTLDESVLLDEFWKAILYPRNPLRKIPRDWKLLGYDVADKYMISGLSNCSYKTNEKKILQQVWLNCLNEHGLFVELDDATRFRDVTAERVASHAPFYVYGLYRI